MPEMIRFQMNEKKTLEALVWLASRHPGLTRHALVKVLYFADKRHLHDYGRPVIGDEYVAMRDGMVPSRVLDMLERDRRHLYDDEIEAIEAGLEEYTNEDGYPAYRARRDPDTDYLSRTDIEALSWSLDEYGDLDFFELKEIAHQDPAWKEAFHNRESHRMDYHEIIDADHPNRERLIEKLHDSSRRLVF